TMAEELGEDAQCARVESALADGLRLIQLREKNWSPERQRALADKLIALARPRGAKVLLNGDARRAQAWGCDGVHWTASALALADGRDVHGEMLCAASCHVRAEVEKAAALGLDFAVLGPVFPTPSHPGARTLGWDGFAAIAARAPMPIYALGG